MDGSHAIQGRSEVLRLIRSAAEQLASDVRPNVDLGPLTDKAIEREVARLGQLSALLRDPAYSWRDPEPPEPSRPLIGSAASTTVKAC